MCLNKWKNKLGGGDNCYAVKASGSEEGKSFSIKRKSKDTQFCRVEVDGCLLTSKEKGDNKCDYLFIHCQKEEFYFVELKGTELMKAIEQLDKTVRALKKKLHKDFPKQFYAFIVCSNVPKAASTKVNLAKRRFFKNHGQQVEINSGRKLEVSER